MGITTTAGGSIDEQAEHTDYFRELAGASSGSTGSEALFSGGGVRAAMDTIDPSQTGTKTGEEALATGTRMLESSATDQASDVLAKTDGGGDPNPGHTTSSESGGSSPSPSPSTANEQANETGLTSSVSKGMAGLSDGALAVGALALVAVAVMG